MDRVARRHREELIKRITRAALLACPLLIPGPLATMSHAVGTFAEGKSRQETNLEANQGQLERTDGKYSRVGALVLTSLALQAVNAKQRQRQEAPAPQLLSIPFKTTYGNVDFPLLLVQATINDKPATLIFDTGAQFLTITPDLAVGLQRMGTVEHVGLGVKSESSRVAVQFKLDGIVFPHCVAETEDLSGISGGLGVKIDGLIGESVLSQFKAVTIDYVNRTVDFTGM
jgi:hypothetical protein